MAYGNKSNIKGTNHVKFQQPIQTQKLLIFVLSSRLLPAKLEMVILVIAHSHYLLIEVFLQVFLIVSTAREFDKHFHLFSCLAAFCFVVSNLQV